VASNKVSIPTKRNKFKINVILAISPKTCQWIEDWVLIELKNK